MTITVDPGQLDGYADQLERNSGHLGGLASYCAAHCGPAGGMTGLLAAARPAVELARDSTADLLASAERRLLQVATNLRAAAHGYRSGDAAAAERIWLVLPRRAAPQGHLDRDDDRHAGDYRDPFVATPAVPAARHEVGAAAEEARHRIGVVDEWLARYTHVTLGEHVLPWLAGDWDALRAAADGYAGLAGPDGLPAIRANLGYGLDSLSSGWDSPAATQFAYTIRDRWLPALDTMRRLVELHREALECLAQQSENTLHAVVLAIEALEFWVVEKVLRSIMLAVPGGLWAEIGMEVMKTWHTITALFEALRLAFAAVREAAQLAGAEATMLEDGLAGGRLDPITVG